MTLRRQLEYIKDSLFGINRRFFLIHNLIRSLRLRRKSNLGKRRKDISLELQMLGLIHSRTQIAACLYINYNNIVLTYISTSQKDPRYIWL